MKCRMCKNNKLDVVLDLGHHPPSDAFLTQDDLLKLEVHYPLQLCKCSSCSLVQLNYTVDAEILFSDSYPYETGINLEGQRHFNSLAQAVYDRFHPSYVIDIGSNDGTLLSSFQSLGCEVLGIEPVESIALNAKVRTVVSFWNNSVLDCITRQADVITACNVFAHVDDLHAFMSTVDTALSPKGVLVIEAPYLFTMLENVEYDTIYHEHLSYIAFHPLQTFCAKFGYVIFDTTYVPIHGGTMRYYIGRQDHYKPIDEFNEDNLDDQLQSFSVNVIKNRDKLNDLLYGIRDRHVVGVSAPAKGNTLLNYCGIGPDKLSYITEKSKLKIGKFTPGQHIPIVSDSQLIADQPDYALLLAWNFKSQIKNALRDYHGKWIIPVPYPAIEWWTGLYTYQDIRA